MRSIKEALAQWQIGTEPIESDVATAGQTKPKRGRAAGGPSPCRLTWPTGSATGPCSRPPRACPAQRSVSSARAERLRGESLTRWRTRHYAGIVSNQECANRELAVGFGTRECAHTIGALISDRLGPTDVAASESLVANRCLARALPNVRCADE